MRVIASCSWQRNDWTQPGPGSPGLVTVSKDEGDKSAARRCVNVHGTDLVLGTAVRAPVHLYKYEQLDRVVAAIGVVASLRDHLESLPRLDKSSRRSTRACTRTYLYTSIDCWSVGSSSSPSGTPAPASTAAAPRNERLALP